jgi:hypothetical protein
MHGLTGGGWKRKRYRPRSTRKLPRGNPRQERPDLPPNQSPPRQPPTLLDRDLRGLGVFALVGAVTAALFRVCEDSRIGRGRRGS